MLQSLAKFYGIGLKIYNLLAGKYFEMAQTVEDILARRLRVLFLDTKSAVELAPKVAGIMARELEKDDVWIAGQIAEFKETAKRYLIVNRQS